MGNKKNSKFNYVWENLYPEDNSWDQNIDVSTLYSILDEASDNYSSAIAIDFFGKKYTYAKLNRIVNKTAKGLQKIGVKKGSKVAIMMPNCPQYIISFFAILKVGGIVVNLNPLYPIKDLKHQVDDLEASILITLNLSLLYNKANNLLQTTPIEKIVICKFQRSLPFIKASLFKIFRADDIASVMYNYVNISFRKLIKNDGKYKEVKINPKNDTALLQYTGGTTGVPKGAILTHNNVSSNIKQSVAMLDLMEEGKESILAVLPFFHIFAMTAIMGVGISKGAKLILHPKFELDKLLKDITKNRPTILAAVPAIFTAINNHPNLEGFNLSSLKFCVSGGAALPISVKEEFEEKAGCPIYEGYGLTENSPVATLNPPFAENKAGSIGIPLPNVVITICNPDNKEEEMPIGEIGEICISGPQVMQGYYNDIPLRDGKLYTGDIGYIDSEGYVFVVDRIKEIIISGGTNIYPNKIESELMMHNAIKEVAAIGVDDEYKGQVVKIYIALRTGESITKKDVLHFLENKIAKFEMPKIY